MMNRIPHTMKHSRRLPVLLMVATVAALGRGYGEDPDKLAEERAVVRRMNEALALLSQDPEPDLSRRETTDASRFIRAQPPLAVLAATADMSRGRRMLRLPNDIVMDLGVESKDPIVRQAVVERWLYRTGGVDANDITENFYAADFSPLARAYLRHRFLSESPPNPTLVSNVGQAGVVELIPHLRALLPRDFLVDKGPRDGKTWFDESNRHGAAEGVVRALARLGDEDCINWCLRKVRDEYNNYPRHVPGETAILVYVRQPAVCPLLLQRLNSTVRTHSLRENFGPPRPEEIGPLVGVEAVWAFGMILEGFPVKLTHPFKFEGVPVKIADPSKPDEGVISVAREWLAEQREFRIRGRDRVYTREELFGKETFDKETPKANTEVAPRPRVIRVPSGQRP